MGGAEAGQQLLHARGPTLLALRLAVCGRNERFKLVTALLTSIFKQRHLCPSIYATVQSSEISTGHLRTPDTGQYFSDWCTIFSML